MVFFEWASVLLANATHLQKQSGIVTRLHRYEMYHSVEWVNWEAVDKIILVSQAKKEFEMLCAAHDMTGTIFDRSGIATLFSKAG